MLFCPAALPLSGPALTCAAGPAITLEGGGKVVHRRNVPAPSAALPGARCAGPAADAEPPRPRGVSGRPAVIVAWSPERREAVRRSPGPPQASRRRPGTAGWAESCRIRPPARRAGLAAADSRPDPSHQAGDRCAGFTPLVLTILFAV